MSTRPAPPLSQLSPGERVAYQRGVNVGREDAERRLRRLPVETWRWQVGPNIYAQIDFYGDLPTRRTVVALKEYLELTERVFDLNEAPTKEPLVGAGDSRSETDQTEPSTPASNPTTPVPGEGPAA